MSEAEKVTRRDGPAASHRGELAPVAAGGAAMVRPMRGMQPPMPIEQGVSFGFVVATLRRWWLICLAVGLVLAAASGAAVYLLFEPVYEAVAWFKIDERTPYLAFESKDEGRATSFFKTQVATIGTPMVLSPVLERPEIARLPELAKHRDKMAWLGKQIKVKAVGESELFQIVYQSPDPKGAADMVNAVQESYFKVRDDNDTARNQRVIDLLGQEVNRCSHEVQRLRDSVRTLAKEATGKDPFAGKTGGELPQGHPLADLEGRLVTAEVERTVLEAKIKAAEDELAANKQEAPADDAEQPQPELSSPRDIKFRDAMVEKTLEDSSEVQKQKALIIAKQSRLKGIEEKSVKGKDDPFYTQMAKDIANDEEALGRLRDDMKPGARRAVELAIIAKRTEAGESQQNKQLADLAKLRSDWNAARVAEGMFKDRYDKQRKNVQESSGDTMELTFKHDELSRAEKVFDLIAQRRLQLQTERGAPGRVTAMQKKVEVPSEPVEVFPYRNVALAVLMALGLPFGLAFSWERLVGRVADPRAFEQQSTLALLGEITQLPKRRSMHRRASQARIGDDIRLFEESIDSLRTSLSLSDDLAGMKVLAVTSAAAHEGKTSVAAQLAVSFARATGQPLLLIDGDMRSPDIHSVFQVPLEPGLATVLSGGCSLEEAIVECDSDNVHLLPAGKLKSNPHKLMGNGAWKSLLAQIPSRYRYVVIDTPPVLAASEALVLAKSADATLVCVMRDVSRNDQVRKAIERLTVAGSRAVGTVLSGVPARHYMHRYGHYAYVDA